jgi:hypothetical protein
MTTIFRVRVEAVDGPHLTLDVDHVYGWEWHHSLVNSRTLALHFLWEPLLGYIRQRIPSPDGNMITWEEADAFALTLPLGRELAGRDHTDEVWNRANAGRFISCVGVVDRRHHNEMWNDTNDARWDYPRHVDREEVETAKATYLIAATNPCWLAHLYPGMEWDSTAYDHDEKVTVDPVWRTPTVLALARQVDGSGDFGVLPILADALQEAGCADERLLGHCRGLGQLGSRGATPPCNPHARGCWAVDLLLGGGFDPRTLDAADVSRVDVEFWPEEEGANPTPVAHSTSTEDIAAVLATVRLARELEDAWEWARGVIRFARRGAESIELLFFPGRDPERYEFRTAGRVYGVGRAAFVDALRRFGVELPLK